MRPTTLPAPTTTVAEPREPGPVAVTPSLLRAGPCRPRRVTRRRRAGCWSSAGATAHRGRCSWRRRRPCGWVRERSRSRRRGRQRRSWRLRSRSPWSWACPPRTGSWRSPPPTSCGAGRGRGRAAGRPRHRGPGRGLLTVRGDRPAPPHGPRGRCPGHGVRHGPCGRPATPGSARAAHAQRDRLSQILGEGEAEVADDVLAAALRAARRTGVTVLAGADTSYVVEPSGDAWATGVGPPGAAVAGSGDVKAGAVAGLVARGATPAQAAAWGCFLHGRACELLAGLGRTRGVPRPGDRRSAADRARRGPDLSRAGAGRRGPQQTVSARFHGLDSGSLTQRGPCSPVGQAVRSRSQWRGPAIRFT